MSISVVLCYVRHEEASDVDEEKEDLDEGSLRSRYYLGGILIDRRHFYGNPIMLKGYLPPLQSKQRLLDLVAQWAPERLQAVAESSNPVGHLVVHHWKEIEGEDPIHYLEPEPDLDQADLLGSWFIPEPEADEPFPEDLPNEGQRVEESPQKA